jgi:hypothetical protein
VGSAIRREIAHLLEENRRLAAENGLMESDQVCACVCVNVCVCVCVCVCPILYIPPPHTHTYTHTPLKTLPSHPPLLCNNIP